MFKIENKKWFGKKNLDSNQDTDIYDMIKIDLRAGNCNKLIPVVKY